MREDLEMIAIGDSAMWGMGMNHEDKYANLFHEYLTGEPLPEENLKAQVGAVIGYLEEDLDHPDEDSDLLDWSENQRKSIAQKHGRERTSRNGRKGVGHGAPTIPHQIENLPYDYNADADPTLTASLNVNVDSEDVAIATDDLPPEKIGPEIDDYMATYADSGDPADVDVVLMNGSINDVGATAPLSIDTDYKGTIDLATRHFSYRGLSRTIEQVNRTFPNATILVCGYFPPLSRESALMDQPLVDWIADHIYEIVNAAADHGLGTLGSAGVNLLDTLLPFLEYIVDVAGPSMLADVLNAFKHNYEYHYKKITFEMRRAVYEQDHALDVSVLFVNPGYERANSTHGSPDDAWLFGLPGFRYPGDRLELPVYFDPESDYSIDAEVVHASVPNGEFAESVPLNVPFTPMQEGSGSGPLDPRGGGSIGIGTPDTYEEALLDRVFEIVFEMDEIGLDGAHAANFLVKNLTIPNFGDQDEDRKGDRIEATRISNQDTGYEYRNAIAHPNPEGARQYFAVLQETWDRNFEEGWDLRAECCALQAPDADDEVDVRTALERYEPLLDPTAGLRACLNNTKIDTMKLEVDTGESGFIDFAINAHLDVDVDEDELVRFNLNPDRSHPDTDIDLFEQAAKPGFFVATDPGSLDHPHPETVLRAVAGRTDHRIVDPIFDDAKRIDRSARLVDEESPLGNDYYDNRNPLRLGEIEDVTIQWAVDEDTREAIRAAREVVEQYDEATGGAVETGLGIAQDLLDAADVFVPGFEDLDLDIEEEYEELSEYLDLLRIHWHVDSATLWINGQEVATLDDHTLGVETDVGDVDFSEPVADSVAFSYPAE